MEAWLIENWGKILLSLVTTGALTFCGYLWGQVKKYHALAEKEEQQKVDEHLEELMQPVLDELEELRIYVREVDRDEKHKIKLIVQSYRYRLCQLCRLYLKQGFMTFDQYDQLNEFFHLYTELGGNGEAKDMYTKVTTKLDTISDEEAKKRLSAK